MQQPVPLLLEHDVSHSSAAAPPEQPRAGRTGNRQWNVRCECGWKGVMTPSRIKARGSCGASTCNGRRKVLKGKLEGTRWTIIKYLGDVHGTNKGFYLCRCNCGTKREVQASNLATGLSKSCGCLARERLRAYWKARAAGKSPRNEISKRK